MNTSRTLEQLEAHRWPEPTADSSPILTRCHALRTVPLASLSAGDCRVLLTQGIGTRYVLPIALNLIDANPLVEGDYYTGDVLTALLRLSPDEWAGNEALRPRLMSAAKRADDVLAMDPEPSGSDIRLRRDIQAALAALGA